MGVGLDAAGEEGLAWGRQIEFWPGWDALICVRAGGRDQQAFSEDGRRCGSGAGKRVSSQVGAEVGAAERQKIMVTSLKRSQACTATVHAPNPASGHH